MKKYIQMVIVAITIIIIVAIVSVFSSPNRVQVRTITTAGECIQNVAKNRTSITLRIVALDSDASRSMGRARAAYNDAVDAIKKIDDKTIEMQTTRFDSYEKTEWNAKSQTSESRGYETTIAIDVSAENDTTIENILSNPVMPKTTGVNLYMENFRMYASRDSIRTATENCIADAVKNASDRADKIAAAAGAHVVRLVSASTSGAPNTVSPMPVMRTMAVNAIAMDAAPINIIATDDTVSVSVNANFQIR